MRIKASTSVDFPWKEMNAGHKPISGNVKAEQKLPDCREVVKLSVVHAFFWRKSIP